MPPRRALNTGETSRVLPGGALETTFRLDSKYFFAYESVTHFRC